MRSLGFFAPHPTPDGFLVHRKANAPALSLLITEALDKQLRIKISDKNCE